MRVSIAPIYTSARRLSPNKVAAMEIAKLGLALNSLSGFHYVYSQALLKAAYLGLLQGFSQLQDKPIP